MVESSLRELNIWYGEPTSIVDRPKFISKLAVLELCGWIEEELDRILLNLENPILNDDRWVRTEIIGKNYGFHYEKHFRGMLCKLVGESVVRRTESQMDQKHPGELQQLKSNLGSLWVKRCSFAHADMTTNVRSQITFDAPSWAINQFTTIRRLLEHYEAVLIDTAFL
jgi:hypothetical protein